MSKKTVFTTGQVARICKVAPRTVSKWFDSGRLRGYRIPGSQDRRIPRQNLIAFLKEHNMPLGELEQDERKQVAIVTTDQRVSDGLSQELLDDEVQVHVIPDGFSLGGLMGRVNLTTVVLDARIHEDVPSLIGRVRQQVPEVRVYALNEERETRQESADMNYLLTDGLPGLAGFIASDAVPV